MTKEAKYNTIFKDILAKILSGEFTEQKLPSIRQLADDYNVSIVTANRAVKELEKSGVVKCCAGNAGTVIDEKQAALLYSEKSSKCVWTDTGIVSGKTTTVRYLCNDFNADNKDIWNELTEAFSKKYPWIGVEIIKKEASVCNLSENRTYDVLQFAGRDVTYFQRQGFLMDITMLVDSFIKKDDFLPHFLNSCTVNGKFFGLPLVINTPVIFYNKKSLGKKSGNLSESWDSFRKMVKATATEGKHSALNIGTVSLLNYFIGDIHNLQKKSVDKDSLRKMVSLLKYLTLLGPDELSRQCANTIEAFRKQKVDFFCTYSSCLERVENKNFECGIAPLPLCKNGIPAMVTVVNGINPASYCKEEAWLFIKFLSSEDGQKILSNKRKYIPVNKNVFDDFYTPQEPASGKVLKDIFKQGRPVSVPTHTMNSIRSLALYLDAHYNNSCEAEETINLLSERIKELLDLENLF